jgi:hypothetical protein
MQLYVKDEHDEPFKRITVQPLYPDDFELPSLAELNNREDYPQYEEIRWKYLKWSVSADKNCEFAKIPKNFLTDILVLTFLRREGFLSIFEADLILLSIKIAQSGCYERSLEQIPRVLDPRGFRVSNLFARFYRPITKSIKLAGLKEFRVS